MSKDYPFHEQSLSLPQATGERDRVALSASELNDLVAAKAEIGRLHAALAAAEVRERTLADELQHRVRNMLAMVRSVTRQTWEEGASQQEYAQHLQGRLDAIARYQGRLGVGKASGIDLEDILRDELLPTQLLDGPRCTISGPPMQLYGKQAELLGLAIHELAVNAIKFGALGQRGMLTVGWSVEEAQLRFRWAESGVSVASSAPRPVGFGRRLIEHALPYQLEATTSFDLKPGGLVCTILLPLLDSEAKGAAGEPPLSLDQAGA